ncbi:MAG: MFS transporter, partial [Lentisphaeria bacterium]
TINSSGFWAYLGVQFLGAFNDNMFKLMLICYAIGVLSKKQVNWYLPLAGAAFVLPFLLFSAYAGFLADRFSKKRVMIWTKVAEILIMLIGAIGFYYHAVWFLLFVLFCMGSQSSFFSPAKYGFLPEVLKDEDLSRGNGLTQLFTFLAIVLGGWIGGVVIAVFKTTPWHGMIFCIAIAVIGWLVSLNIYRTRPGNVRTVFQLDPFTPHWRTFKKMRKDQLLLLGLLGCSFFWMIGTFFQLMLPLILKQTLEYSDTIVGYAQAILALGIGLGCSVAGVLSRKKIEYGLVLPGVFFIGVFTILLGICAFHWMPIFLFAGLIGFFGGFYQLPLQSTIQKRSPNNCLGSYLGAANALDCIAMILGTVLQFLCLNIFFLGTRGAFIFCGIMVLIVSLVMMHKVPALIYRFKRMFL